MRSLVFGVFLSIASVGTASAVTTTLDFADLATGQQADAGESFVYEGFRFTPFQPRVDPQYGEYLQQLSVREDHLDRSFLGCYAGRTDLTFHQCGFRMERADNQTFDVSGLLFALDGYGITYEVGSVTIEGLGIDGHVYSAASGETMGVGFTDYLFAPAWNDLTSLVVEYRTADSISPFVGITNVSVSYVPIPAAAWLFGSALVGLGWLRRRQT